MEKPEDLQLYEQLRSGDKASLEALYDKYEKLLYSFAYKMVRDPGAAEEVVQEVMIKLWRGIGDYAADKGKFSSWLLTITRNTAIDYLRKQKRVKSEEVHQEFDTADTQQSVEELVEWKEQGDRLRQAMKHLKHEQQVIIEMFYFKGYSQRMIADEVDIPLGTVKGRIRLALKNLRNQLYQERGDLQ
ncbi:sigma-70 family RNA polymerase sigma factor [Paenalkalicoccus suaedae]|uniref:Sigma-70 family RNA polymerase sigma factor n=1 Tax=Paenalkalicoccus suaedae TaxID=2592382 RepID=A0A859FBQ3_9BACI|nr:sigma-70 family RNA polymerase sigma factor [Paenalkalicoccus suaedae]QKS70390.1 sigma-70 family RNA polymerase sigma factor [Paenalkalicoccus suaedae]